MYIFGDHLILRKSCCHMNASIYNSDSSALRKLVRHVGHKIDRALESHSDIVSLRIIFHFFRIALQS